MNGFTPAIGKYMEKNQLAGIPSEIYPRCSIFQFCLNDKAGPLVLYWFLRNKLLHVYKRNKFFLERFALY